MIVEHQVLVKKSDILNWCYVPSSYEIDEEDFPDYFIENYEIKEGIHFGEYYIRYKKAKRFKLIRDSNILVEKYPGVLKVYGDLEDLEKDYQWLTLKDWMNDSGGLM